MLEYEAYEAQHVIVRPVESLFIAREKIARTLARRAKLYGYPCFITQEYRAVHMATYYHIVLRGKQELALQEWVARSMGCSQSWVSKLLSRADDVGALLDARGVYVGWEARRGVYTFVAPVSEMPMLLPVIKLPTQYSAEVIRKAA